MWLTSTTPNIIAGGNAIAPARTLSATCLTRTSRYNEPAKSSTSKANTTKPCGPNTDPPPPNGWPPHRTAQCKHDVRNNGLDPDRGHSDRQDYFTLGNQSVRITSPFHLERTRGIGHEEPVRRLLAELASERRPKPPEQIRHPRPAHHRACPRGRGVVERRGPELEMDADGRREPVPYSVEERPVVMRGLVEPGRRDHVDAALLGRPGGRTCPPPHPVRSCSGRRTG